jgi:hypothetical protein
MNNGKLSLDMLVGISIFLFTFIFIAQFLPSVFAGERGISLVHEAYKVTVLLSENEGKWSNGTANGTDWEKHWNKNVIFLPGLASEKPNRLGYSKISAFRNATNDNYQRVKEMLGLKTPNSEYNFHVSLEKLSSRSYERIYSVDCNGSKILDVGKPIPTQAVRFERLVYLEEFEGVVNATRVKKVPSVEQYTVTLNAPVGTFVLDIFEAEYGNTSAVMFIEVKIGSKTIFKIQSTNDPSEVVGVHDITDAVNGNATGITDVTIRLKNCGGKILWTNAGEYIAGRVVAKLVVVVW